MNNVRQSPQLGQLIQAYFADHLINQHQASAATIQSYRDLFRLLLHYAIEHHRCRLAELTLGDVNPALVLAFLDHLESARGNTARTRNARLATIRSFLHFAVLKDPTALASVQAVLAIPRKRHDRPALRYLSEAQIAAILDAPDPRIWSGRRDRILLKTLYNSGARVSEIAELRRSDLGSHPRQVLHLRGKGRKERIIPLWQQTADQLRQWLESLPLDPQTPLFPNRFGRPMSRSGIEQRLAASVQKAEIACPSLADCRVSPHVIRHTTAMHLLQSGVDLTVIALWLGHESVETTHGYVEANLAMKEEALGKLQEPGIGSSRYQPPSDVLAFLDSL